MARKLRSWGAWLPVGVLLGALLLQIADPSPLVALRHAVFDHYQRLRPRPKLDLPVRVVDIDEASLARFGQWPWPRTRIAELAGTLTRMGAAAVVFDVLFAEPDRTSPRQLLKLWQLPPPLAAELAAQPDHDEVLAAALVGRSVVLGFVLRDQPGAAALPLPWRFVEQGPSPATALHEFAGRTDALPALEAAAAGYGALNFLPDEDGVVRRIPLVLGLAGAPQPSLIAEALRVAAGERNYLLRSSGAEKGIPESLGIGSLALPLTPSGEFWIHYAPSDPRNSIPAWCVFPEAGAARIGADAVAGKIVLIGSSAAGLMDLRFSPLGGVIPGVEVHAQALEQILSGDRLQRPGWARAAELLALLLGGGALALVTLRLKALPAVAAMLLLAGGGIAAGWQAYGHGLLLDPATPLLGTLAVYLSASLVRHRRAEARQRYLREAFARYVSPNLVRHLVAHPEALALGGERRRCSFVFTDLAGFTALMEKLDPAQAVAVLNTYLERMVEIAFAHQGTLDRIVGDAVAVLFSAPVPQADHARRALACALEMQAFTHAYAAEVRAGGIPLGGTRIGVHSGEVVVGNFGGESVFDYRALGDVVNTASRLEGANRYLGTWVCVSEACAAECPEAAMRPIGRLRLLGREGAVMAYEPEAAAGAGRAPLADYRAAYSTLAGEDRAAALAAFEALARRWPEDTLVALHLARLQRGEGGDLVVLAGK